MCAILYFVHCKSVLRMKGFRMDVGFGTFLNHVYTTYKMYTKKIETTRSCSGNPFL